MAATPSNSQSREPAQDVASVLGKVHPKLEFSLRQPKGAEVLATIGLDARWIPECARPSRKLSTDMAGNAFSGFCVLPVLTALLATVTPDSQPIPAQRPQQVMDDQEDDDSSSN